MHSRYDMSPKTVWKDGLPIGFEATCPDCGKKNFCKFSDQPPHTLEWWPTKEHCYHFRGLYSSGRIAEPYAIFHDSY